MYIGIDLGTTSVKTILTNDLGEVLKESTKHYPLLIPKPNWTEQDPNLWYEKTLEALQELVLGYEDNIKAISFSGQMHGMVILDKDDKVIRNALLWNDQRTYQEVDYLNNVIGKDKIIKNTGNIAVTGLTAPKVMWLYNNEIENFNKINKIMLPKDYLVYKLTNVFATDYSDVSGTLYFDVENKKYSKFMLDVLKIKEEQLPKVYSSYAVVGYLSDDIKTLLNITNNVKIVVGGGDQAVGAIGVGIVDDSIMNISLGTSGVVFKPLKDFSVDLKTNMQVYVHANDEYHIMGVMLNAAGSLKWWAEDVLETKDYNNLFLEIKDLNINDTLYFLPYLTGERAPVNNPNAEGVFIGLRADHKKEHLSQAVIEGISFNLRQIYENINAKVKKARITGGGAKNPIWGQILANIFNLELETIEVEEGPALGAAILAMVGDGLYKDVLTATKAVIKPKHTYIPNSDVTKYEEKYRKYIKIYPNIEKLFIK